MNLAIYRSHAFYFLLVPNPTFRKKNAILFFDINGLRQGVMKYS
jgi:hypothetical protein